ncbi:MAG: hypothetical protein AB7K09_10725 [Planctomycetota bacterium]
MAARLADRCITIVLTSDAMACLAARGYHTECGAHPLRPDRTRGGQRARQEGSVRRSARR